MARESGEAVAEVGEAVSEGSSEEEPYAPVRVTRVVEDSPPSRSRRRRLHIDSEGEDSA